MSRFAGLLVVAAAVAGCGKNLPSDWVTVPTRASHEAFFPIAAGPHAAADCNDCHGAFNTFKQFGCTASACHAQPQIDTLHATVAGYASDGPSCYGCHPKGTMAAPANHDTAFFPRGPGTVHGNASVGCTQCHLDLTKPNDPTKFGCYTCHSTLATGWPHPDPVSGVSILVLHTLTAVVSPINQTASSPIDVTNPANCLLCHADSQVNTVASHPTGNSSPFQNGTHGGAGCLTCHSATRSDKTFGADFSTTGAAGSGVGCGTCHTTLPQ